MRKRIDEINIPFVLIIATVTTILVGNLYFNSDFTKRIFGEINNDQKQVTPTQIVNEQPKQTIANNEEIKQTINIPSIDKNQKTTPIHIYDNQIIVPVMLFNNGKFIDCNLLLDTGANYITVSEDIANRLNIHSDQTKKMISTVAHGRTTTGYMTIIDGVRVGAAKANNVELGVMKMEKRNEYYDGLLGMSFLKNFKYHVDFDRKVINWF